MNSLANNCDTIPSTGRQDSILIAYNDLRKVNAKLIELEYEKDINKHLRTIVSNDSIAINTLRRNIDSINIDANNRINKANKVRNIACGVSVVSVILLVLSLL